MSSASCRHYSSAWNFKPNFVLLEFCVIRILWADHGLKAFTRPKPLAATHSISADALHLGCILSQILAIPRKRGCHHLHSPHGCILSAEHHVSPTFDDISSPCLLSYQNSPSLRLNTLFKILLCHSQHFLVIYYLAFTQ